MSSTKVSHSDKHKNVVGHIETKNETHSKTGNHGQINHTTTNHSNVHVVKDSKKHAHTDDTIKHREVTNTHGKITTHGHSDTRGISKKSSGHKQQVDKQDTIEHDNTDPDKTDHSRMDHAVFISITTAPEDTTSEDSDAVNPNQA